MSPRSHLPLLCLLAALAASTTPASADEDPVAACDRLAGNPFDKQHVGPGVLASEGDWPAAVTACRAAVAAHPDNARMHYQLGRSLDDSEEKGREFKTAAEQGYLAARASLGGAEIFGWYGLTDPAKGRQDLQQALDGGETVAADGLGNLYEFGLGAPADLAAAERYYRIGADAGIPDALNNYAWMLETRTDRHDEAQALATRALAIEPKNPDASDTLAVILLHKKQPDKALPYILVAVASAGDDASTLDHYGDILAALGRKPEAVEQWRKALAGTPPDGGRDLLFSREAIEKKLAGP